MENKEFLTQIESIVNKAIEQRMPKEDFSKELSKMAENFKGFEDGIKQAEENYAKLEKSFAELSTEVKKGFETVQPEKGKTIAEIIKKTVEKHNSVGQKDVYVKFDDLFDALHKSVNTITEGTNLAGRVIMPDRLQGINELTRNTFSLRPFANVGRTVSNYVEWIEETASNGDAAMTAENALKAQIDMLFELKTEKVKKVTAFGKVTTEALADAPYLESFIRGELLYKLAYRENAQLLLGNGVGENLKGIANYAQTLDLASLQGTVVTPTIFDCVNAAITQIIENGKGRFVPNTYRMHPVDVFKAKSEKDADGKTLYPNFEQMFPGMQLVIDSTLTAGTFIVGDMKMFNIFDREMPTIYVGLSGEDFTYNRVTILAEQRLVSFVKGNDVEAIIKDTFTNAKVFIGSAS